MFSNTAKSSANDSVNTRPRLKPYLTFIKNFFRNNQRQIALVFGYVLIGSLFFALGRYSTLRQSSEISVEEPAIDLTQIYDNLNLKTAQFGNAGIEAVSGEIVGLNCEGKIKGNVGSSGKIYHVPGGAFYDRTNPEICFETEDEAKAAGFRKSMR